MYMYMYMYATDYNYTKAEGRSSIHLYSQLVVKETKLGYDNSTHNRISTCRSTLYLNYYYKVLQATVFLARLVKV